MLSYFLSCAVFIVTLSILILCPLCSSLIIVTRSPLCNLIEEIDLVTGLKWAWLTCERFDWLHLHQMQDKEPVVSNVHSHTSMLPD